MRLEHLQRGVRMAIQITDFFLIIGMVILIGFTGRLVRQRHKLPESLFLILFGLFLGPMTGLAPGDVLLEFVPIVSVAAMVAILVESGIEFDVLRLTSTLSISLLFTLLVAALTTLFITAFLMFFFGWDPAYAALLGLISSGTTTLTAMSLLNSIDVSNKLRRVVLLETILNDFTLILGTFLIVEYIKVSDMSLEMAGRLIFSELSVGLMLGLVFGFAWRYVLAELNKNKGLNYASTLGLCFFLYYVASLLGGNPIIAIFSFSLLLGNYHRIYSTLMPDAKDKESNFNQIVKSIRLVQTDFTFFMSSFFFVLLGVTFDLMLFDEVSALMIAGLLGLIILTRYMATVLMSRLDKVFTDYKGLMSIMIPRGYVAAVLAFVPAQEGIQIPNLADIIVILLVVTTLIAIVGTTVYARRKGAKA
jgi:cell volume regulation protein A